MLRFGGDPLRFPLLFLNRVQSLGLGQATGTMPLVAVRAGIRFLRAEGTAVQPLLNPSPFRNMTFSFANIGALLSLVFQHVMVFVTPFYLQRVPHYAPNNAGLIMTAFSLAIMALAPFDGSLCDRIGTRVPACLGAATCALTLGAYSQVHC